MYFDCQIYLKNIVAAIQMSKNLLQEPLVMVCSNTDLLGKRDIIEMSAELFNTEKL